MLGRIQSTLTCSSTYNRRVRLPHRIPTANISPHDHTSIPSLQNSQLPISPAHQVTLPTYRRLVPRRQRSSTSTRNSKLIEKFSVDQHITALRLHGLSRELIIMSIHSHGTRHKHNRSETHIPSIHMSPAWNRCGLYAACQDLLPGFIKSATRCPRA